MKKNTPIHSLLWLAALGFSTVLAACENDTLIGRVIDGPGSVVSSVNAKDPRLLEPGVGSTTVVVRKFAGEGVNGPIVASGVSGPDGQFRIPMDDKSAETGELIVTAKTPDQRISRGKIFYPPPGQQLLIVVRSVH